MKEKAEDEEVLSLTIKGLWMMMDLRDTSH